MIAGALWKYGCLGVTALCLALSVALWLEKIHSGKLSDRVTVLTAKLSEISSKKNEQHSTTSGNIKHADDGRKKAEQVKERIIKTPNPPNCSTPALDELRNEL
jgi:hypothetical protein